MGQKNSVIFKHEDRPLLNTTTVMMPNLTSLALAVCLKALVTYTLAVLSYSTSISVSFVLHNILVTATHPQMRFV
jgi:hypothetical protein